MSRVTSAAAPLIGAALIAADAWLRRGTPPSDRPMPPAAPGPSSTTRMLDRKVTTTLCALSLASVCLVAIPFAPYGWERADGIHRTALTDWEKHLRMTTTVLGSKTFPPPHPYIHADPEPSY